MPPSRKITTTILNVSVCFLLVFISSSCKKGSNSPSTSNDVYVAGTLNGKATYWKNGNPVTLADSAQASGIVINNNDAYINGVKTTPDGEYTFAVYWKNGIMTNLGLGATSAIALVGTDLYITGSVLDSSGNYQAAFWKNGMLNVLGSGQAYGICTSGSDVYIAGVTILNNTVEATYWKNGIQLNLGYGVASSVTVQGGDVYVGGYANLNNSLSAGCYWKNGILDTVGSQADISDIKISGDNIYLAGYKWINGLMKAAYWKNKSSTILDEGYIATSLAVSGNDVYVTGFYPFPKPMALLWKNGNVVINANGNGSNANNMAVYTVAQDVVVVQH